MNAESNDVQVLAAYLRAKDAAALVGVSEATWWRWCDVGETPAPVRKSRGFVRWPRSEIDAWMDAGMPNREAWERQKSQASKVFAPKLAT